jgi:hypothetical protein
MQASVETSAARSANETDLKRCPPLVSVYFDGEPMRNLPMADALRTARAEGNMLAARVWRSLLSEDLHERDSRKKT